MLGLLLAGLLFLMGGVLASVDTTATAASRLSDGQSRSNASAPGSSPSRRARAAQPSAAPRLAPNIAHGKATTPGASAPPSPSVTPDSRGLPLGALVLLVAIALTICGGGAALFLTRRR